MTRVSRATLSAALDLAIFAAGTALALPFVVLWAMNRESMDLANAVATVLIVVMARFPLVLTHRSGDVVIGFETCVLVFLVLTEEPAEAFALWAIGTTIANILQRKSWRSRLFNVGLTILGGAMLVSVVSALDPGRDQPAGRLAAVMFGCALYFTFDLVVTAVSIAVEDGCPVSSVLRWGSIPVGLAVFVSIDTLGYLAALLHENRPAWTLLLLLVPVATILVAVRSVSDNRLAQRRLEGLLDAAIHAPDWSDEDHIERALVLRAERTLRHTTAQLRAEPAGDDEIGAPLEVEGRPTQYLVITHQSSTGQFDDNDRGALEALAAIGVSAFNRRRLNDEMVFLAQHDALTGLHNRAVFTDRLTHALERRSSRLIAVMYCDLDGFKEVNDLLGHETGDQLLTLVANRIRDCLRVEDTAARLGGDEFGILLDDLVDEAQAEAVGHRLLEALGQPFDTGDQQVRVRVSIGVAYTDHEPSTAELLINCADTAMYAAKARGKGRLERFIPEMRAAELDRLELEAALRDAVRDDEITLQYQPVVDLSTGVIDGFEALARWRHATLGNVPPDVFIPAAERLGLIRTLGMQILDRAHGAGIELSRAAGRAMSLGVNLSAPQVTDLALAHRVADLQAAHPEVRIILELTEGMLLADDPETTAALTRLKGCGVRLAIDDFGVGYSSVGYLHRLPVDILKIDKLFVAELHDPRSHALVEGVVAMARAMDLMVITEGVEDWNSAAALRDLRCDFAQGYVFSRPVDLDVAMGLASAGGIDVSEMMRVAVPLAVT
jgi:diguanylate cyclase (GGDEF)-like protein